MVYVPDVVGQPLENARDSLQSIRLLLSPYQAVTTEHPPGTVMEQFPAAGSKVGIGTTVYLKIATISEIVNVPDLIGQPLEKAREVLQSIRLPFIQYDTVTTAYPPGTVMGQFPATDSIVGVGTTVYLKVATRPEMVDVPDLVGQPLEKARDSLQSIRLLLSPYQAVTTEHAPGTVIEQFPAAGNKVEVGTTIFLKVATFSEIIDVPDLVGQPLEKARELLQNIRLLLIPDSTFTTEQPKGIVIEQSPAAGSKVRVGTTVYLQIAKDEDASNPLLLYIVLGVLGILAVGMIFKSIRKKKLKSKTAGGSTPDIRIKSQIHPGSQKIPQKSVVKADLKVRLKPFPDGGKQTILPNDNLILKVQKGADSIETNIASIASQIDYMDETDM